MKKLFLFLGLALTFSFSSASADKASTPLIVGGVEATPGEYSFIVSLRDDSGHFCGGSLILPDVILTAAHCTDESIDMKSVKIFVGTHSQSEMLPHSEVFEVESFVRHPKYGVLSSLDLDFALIKIKGQSALKPISLNTKEFEIPEKADGVQEIMATAIGWGVTTEGHYKPAEKLQKVDVPLVSQKTCNEAYKGKITDSMLCAGFKEGKKDSCQMDSGGPLVTKNENGSVVLAGVVSWGAGCARPEAYGVYSKVSFAHDWIETEALRLSKSVNY